jgi:hypothetical protein
MEFQALSQYGRHLLLTQATFAQELEKCGKQAPADILYQQVLGQLNNAEKQGPDIPTRQRLDFEGVSCALSEMVRQDALAILSRFKLRFSSVEQRLLLKKLDTAEAGHTKPPTAIKSCGNGLSMGPIRRIREELIEKIRRLPGRSAPAERSIKNPVGSLEEGIGLYNTYFNTTALLKFLESRDGEWTSDLRDCLGQLQKIEVLLD